MSGVEVKNTDNKRRVALASAVAIVSILLGITAPTFIPSVSAVNSHIVVEPTCKTINATGCFHVFPAGVCAVQGQCGLPISGKATKSGNVTLYNWYFFATATNGTKYLCFVQTNWTSGNGTIVISAPMMGDNNTYCQRDTG